MNANCTTDLCRISFHKIRTQSNYSAISWLRPASFERIAHAHKDVACICHTRLKNGLLHIDFDIKIVSDLWGLCGTGVRSCRRTEKSSPALSHMHIGHALCCSPHAEFCSRHGNGGVAWQQPMLMKNCN